MSSSVRYLIIAAIPVFFCLATPGMAKDSPAKVEAAKACTKECGKKYGTGMPKDEKKYDAQRYESCMTDCMSNTREVNPSARK